MTFELTPKQIEALDLLIGPETHDLLYGGSRSTKTFLLCYAIACRAMAAQESRHLIARLHNIDVRQSVMMDTWPKMMRLAFPDFSRDRSCQPNKSDQFVTFPNGSEIWFGGLDDKDRIDKILGKEFATVFANECSQISFDAIQTLRSRLAQSCRKVDKHGTDHGPLKLKAYYDLNPVGQSHWSYLEFIKGVRPENGLPLEAGERRHMIMNPADNPHLPAAYLKILDEMPDRQRQRFRDGKYISEIPGALWTSSRIEECRRERPEILVRIVVGVDPSGSDGTGGDSQGIISVGKGEDGHAYVIRDDSCRLAPDGWAKTAVGAYHGELADVIVAEINYGGAMVESTIRTADDNVNVKCVTASRGKHVRAEPVSALYEQGKVHHCGHFPLLEEQMTMTTTAGYQGGTSPDRLDALVWAITELMLGENELGMLDFIRNKAADAKPTEREPGTIVTTTVGFHVEQFRQ